MTLTADVLTAVVLSAIVNDDNRRCALLQVLTGGESTDDEMSGNNARNKRQANQHMR